MYKLPKYKLLQLGAVLWQWLKDSWATTGMKTVKCCKNGLIFFIVTGEQQRQNFFQNLLKTKN